MNETSQPIDLLLSVRRDGHATLGAQIEDQLRNAIRARRLHPGARLPSTRELARQLDISRRIVVEAYTQLAAEGYLALRQGAHPSVSHAAAISLPPLHPEQAAAHRPRFDFRPSIPDVTAFPRKAWLRSLRRAVDAIADADLGYSDVRGLPVLRSTLADYLGRVRGVVADPDLVVVTSGYTQGLGVICHTLAAAGAKRVAVEDPSEHEWRQVISRAGLEPVSVPVDSYGLRVDALPHVDAVIVTPAHQHPTGVVLAPERRAALLSWLREHDAVAIEDDYDDPYRYDRAPVGALQGLAPDLVIYAGSVSKTLAPALRLGWLVVPAALLDAVTHEKLLTDRGTARIDQLALADFVARGEADRHLRRMRARYRVRRELFVVALAAELPDAIVKGIPAGLHVTVQLPPHLSVDAVETQARERGIVFETNADYELDGPPTLMLGYARTSDAAIRAGVRELAAAVRAAAGEDGGRGVG